MDVRRVCGAVAIAVLWGVPAHAQPEPIPPGMHQPGEPAPAAASGWHLMMDGVVYGLFNHQGGPRGGTEFVVPNWWMGMLMRAAGRHQFGLNAMLSFEAATVGRTGYGEIFQVGETLDGLPIIDRQHPHDLLMQLAASWRLQIGDRTSVAVAGGPAGEPTLGPVAYIHRASAAGLPFAPLGHHTFDSTHVSYGAVTAALDHGRWTLEGSAFNAREPDEDRWDLDLGPLDSVAARVWFRPTNDWHLQVSTGRLREPHALEPGDAQRTTASVSWMRRNAGGLRAATSGYGVSAAHGTTQHGAFAEFTGELGRHALAGRLDVQQVQTALLAFGVAHHDHGGGQAPQLDVVTALTLGAARQLGVWHGFDAALAANVTFHHVPDALHSTHGQHPVSFQLHLRVRLPTGSGGRMWEMRMSAPPRASSPLAGHAMH